MMFPVEHVQARWDMDGSIHPQRFQWEGQAFQVTSVGRSWRDEAGYHVLCMAGGDAVYELLLTPQLTWQVRPPVRPSRA